MQLHELKAAHCFEAWDGGQLVGGLYGLAIGNVFFGESMFTQAPNASKVAFAAAVAYLSARRFVLIDCQVPSAHLSNFGAVQIPRRDFLNMLHRACAPPRPADLWTEDFAHWQATRCGAHATP